MLRRSGIVTAVVCGWVLVGMAALQGERPEIGAVPVAAAVLPAPAAPAPAFDPAVASAQQVPLPQEAPRGSASASRPSQPAPAPAPERRGNRRARRNVWVGPIPSPADWAPPEGPVRIALQAGHWRADEAPAELFGLRDNGTSAVGLPEWQVNLDIAERAAELLTDMGYLVDVLPAVVPPSYRAHLFISIHADGSGDPRASGFRVAAPRNDRTGHATGAARLLEQSYADATGIKRLPTVTRRMQNYYAFNFQRYVHALHPLTIGVILETGFLTSAADREIIVDAPERAARGIAAAVMAFPLTPPPGPTLPALAGGGAE
jgi:N-acetylmuramoyl-L-alanine amidase